MHRRLRRLVMDIEFHYWITGILAKEAGFTEEESKTIAYSAQFVDENDVSVSVKDKSTGEKYMNFISQTMNILKPKSELMRVYPIFHFVPGQPEAPSARRRDGKMHLFNTTPNNAFVNQLMQNAFSSATDIRLYMIGIATHGYEDTWAHQNFTGWRETFNAVGMNAIPNIGHADALHHPDWVGHRWIDDRLVDSEINNNNRFLSAAKELFKHYCDYLISTGRYLEEDRPGWQSVQNIILGAMGDVSSGDQNYGNKQRITHYENLAPWLPEFDEAIWFNDAIETKVRGLPDSKNGLMAGITIFKDAYSWREDKDKTETDWYGFQRAVKQHERYALNLLSPHFAQIGVNLSEA
jgi:hypothetical protein